MMATLQWFTVVPMEFPIILKNNRKSPISQTVNSSLCQDWGTLTCNVICEAETILSRSNIGQGYEGHVKVKFLIRKVY